MVMDESHVTLPQVRAMYAGDRSRKDSLVNNGFRLPSAYDNRPLKFEEFEKRINQIVYVSATPGDYEMEQTETVLSKSFVRQGFLIQKSKFVQLWVKWMTSLVKLMPVLKKASVSL